MNMRIVGIVMIIIMAGSALAGCAPAAQPAATEAPAVQAPAATEQPAQPSGDTGPIKIGVPALSPAPMPMTA